MKAHPHATSYHTHHTYVVRTWLMTLQYIFLTTAVACIIVLAWFPEIWFPAAVTTVVLLIAGAVCKSGRQ